MRLTASSLAEMIDSLRSNTGQPGERRKKPRIGLRVRAEIALPSRGHDGSAGEGPRLTVWVRDVSAGGIGILSEHAFERGDRFALLLGADGPHSRAQCTVMNCRKVDSRLYGTGAKFIDYDPPPETGRMRTRPRIAPARSDVV
jgi:hypothetical protein